MQHEKMMLHGPAGMKAHILAAEGVKGFDELTMTERRRAVSVALFTICGDRAKTLALPTVSEAEGVVAEEVEKLLEFAERACPTLMGYAVRVSMAYLYRPETPRDDTLRCIAMDPVKRDVP